MLPTREEALKLIREGMLWTMLIATNTYICLVHQFIIQNI